MWDGDFPNLAVGYSIKQTNRVERPLPLVIGFSTLREVHEAVKVWREITRELETEKRKRGEEYSQDVIKNSGYLDWSWASP
jgi:D-arabinose 1-dehydrogenase